MANFYSMNRYICFFSWRWTVLLLSRDVYYVLRKW